MSSHAVARPFRERISNFLNSAYPGELGRHATATRRSKLPEDVPNVAKAAELQDYIRQLRAKKINQPDAERTWEVGGALSRLAGKAWVNPVVMLFVFGHYDRFADVMTRAVSAGSIERKTAAEMVRLLPRLTGSQPKQLSFANIQDQLAIAEARAWAADVGGGDPPEIRLWSIGAEEYAAFAQAWRARGSSPPPSGAEGVIGICSLIAKQATYPIEERDLQVSAVLSEWLSR